MNRRADLREMSNAGEHIMKNVKGVMGGAEELLRATAHVSGEGLAAVRSKVEGQLEELREALGDIGENAWERARDTARETDRYVHRNPWQAIGIAAAVGVLLGYFSHRR